MPTLSAKSISMPSSPIRKLVPYAEAAKRRGIKVHHLNIGQPDIATPQVALDALSNINEQVIYYTHSAGNESYRRGLASYYGTKGIDVTMEDIIVTTGGSEAILFAFMACMNSGDELITPEPFYANYNGFAVEASVVIKPVASGIDTDFALPPISEIEKMISDKTKAILICNPNNPTGYLYSESEIRELGAIAKRHNLFLIFDEVYREFCYDGKRHFSVMEMDDLRDNAIMVDSISKRYSMCGARVGALVSRNKDFMQAVLKFAQARLCPPFIAQIAAEAALSTPDSYFLDVQAEYVKRRDFLVRGLNSIEGVYCPTPSGAFYAVVRFPVANADHFAQWLLEDFSFEGQTVMLAPASGFYATSGLGVNEVRVAYVLQVDDLAAAVKCLNEALKVYSGTVR